MDRDGGVDGDDGDCSKDSGDADDGAHSNRGDGDDEGYSYTLAACSVSR